MPGATREARLPTRAGSSSRLNRTAGDALVRLSTLALAAILVLAAGGRASADVVELLSGERLAGTVEQLTPTTVLIRRDGGMIALPRETVRTITLDPSFVPAPPRPGPVREAIDALKALEATNRSVAAFADSAARLRAARAAVGRYLASLGPAEAASPNPLRAAVTGALEYLSLASAAMQPLSDARLAAIGRDPALDSCSHVQEVLQRDLGRFTSPDAARNRGMAVSLFGITELWTCAAEKIAEAERRLQAVE